MLKDQELVDGCIEGKPASQKALYVKYSRKMMGVCVRYIKSKSEAQDVFQEAFVKVYNSIQTFKGQNLEAWMKRIFVNMCINAYYKNKKYLFQEDYENVTEVHFEFEDVFSAIANEELLAIIDQLPEGYKMVFNLYAIEGYSHKEISEMLGIAEGTSKSQLAKAKRLLKIMLLKLYPKIYENR